MPFNCHITNFVYICIMYTKLYIHVGINERVASKVLGKGQLDSGGHFISFAMFFFIIQIF
jgi:hypothetical protein